MMGGSTKQPCVRTTANSSKISRRRSFNKKSKNSRRAKVHLFLFDEVMNGASIKHLPLAPPLLFRWIPSRSRSLWPTRHQPPRSADDGRPSSSYDATPHDDGWPTSVWWRPPSPYDASSLHGRTTTHGLVCRAVPNSTIGGQINTTFLVEFL